MERKRHDRERDREDYKEREEAYSYAQKKILQSLQAAAEDMRESNSMVKEFFEHANDTMRRIEDAVEAQKDSVSAVFDVINQLNSTMKCILEVEKMKIRRLELEATHPEEDESPVRGPIMSTVKVVNPPPSSAPTLMKLPKVGPIPPGAKGLSLQAALKPMLAHTRCYRCNKGGHQSPECPLIEYGLWFCYYCQEVREHKGDNCPKSNKSNRFKPYGDKSDYDNHRKGKLYKPDHRSD